MTIFLTKKLIIFVLLSLCFFIGIITSQDSDSSKAIHVSLVSNWGNTPLYLESLMFFKERVDVSIYHKYIDQLATSLGKIESYSKLSDKERYDMVVDVAKSVLADDAQFYTGALLADLTMRTFSPKVELLRQLYIAASASTSAVSSNEKSLSPLIQIGSVTLNDLSIGSIDQAIKQASATEQEKQKQLQVYAFDTVFGNNINFDSQLFVDNGLPVVVYYANVFASDFITVHHHLEKLAADGKIVYVLRFTVKSSEQPAKLQGYGYGLAIKNLEYKVMDDSVIAQDEKQQEGGASDMHEDVAGFNFKVLQDRHPQLLSKFKTFRKFLLAHQQTTDLKVWEVKDIGIQSAQKIISSSDPMRSMKFITSTFPSLARSLSRLSLNDTVKKEIEDNQKLYPAGSNHLFLNDLYIDLEEEFTINPIGLNDIIYDEIQSKLEMSKLGLTPRALTKVSTTMSQMNPVRFDILPDDSTVFYINNIEKDYMYKRWDKSFQSIQNGIDSNSIYLAKNIFTAIVMVDMDTEEAYTTLGQINTMINNNVPVRFGILFATDRGADVRPGQIPNENIVKVFAAFWKHMGQRAAFYFINALNYYRQQYDMSYVNHQLVQAAFQTVVNQMHNRIPGGLHSVLESTQMDGQLLAGNQFIASKGISTFPQVFVNGLSLDIKSGNPVDALLSLAQQEMRQIKKLHDDGIIHDSTADIYKTMMEHYRDTVGLMSSFNPLIIPTEVTPLKYVQTLTHSPNANTQKLANKLLTDVKWFEDDSNIIKLLSNFVVGNFDDSLSSVKLALNALARFAPDAKPATQVRYALLSTGSGPVSKLLSHPQITLKSAVDLLNKQVEQLESKTTPLTLEQALSATKLPNNPLLNQINHDQLVFIKEYLGLPLSSSQTSIIVNGRLINIDDNDVFDEFYFLECYEIGKATNILSDIQEPDSFSNGQSSLTNNQYSTILMRLMSSLGKRIVDSPITKKSPPSELKPSFTYKVNSNAISDLLRFTMVVNPLSKLAQKLIPIITEFAHHYGIPCDVILNVQLSLSEMPMKNYYTYVVQLDNTFDSNGMVVSEPGGTLVNLPESRVLTLAMDAPVDWIVSPIIAKYDLDNIRLKDLGNEKVMRAVYALEHLLVQGSALDVLNFQPPGGLELQLSSLNSKVSTDTIVMGNGYFQLQGNPGVWSLDTVGRGHDIFDTLNVVDRKVSSLKNARTVPHLMVAIDSFRGSNAFLGLRRKEGQEHTPVLPPVEDNQAVQQPEEAEDESYFFNWLKNEKKDKHRAGKVSSTNETIHVFSVASGHLYERFLKIMMLSVKKNTNNPVKFWFLKNYLSPKFVDFIPFFAKTYGFEYELVTYQWPPWLRAQTEKQRIIWAYKILFLDVLFPLDVKKIIFVDADQVVRTDLKELWDMDLQGAALGYTPFCDSNKDTEGFRFWKSGFWRDHLRGKPYHISALYVIDLQRFRRIIAGDNLRMTYDQLSRDPNSLANLDQDLPNYLQHSVRIFSLPQEWLWCETWCSQESKAKAKTIDLCNNPMTKTPKLENAVRIIDEWTTIDNEAKGVEKEYEVLKLKQKPTATASTTSSTTSNSQSSQTIATTKYEEPTPNQDLINQALIDAANEFI